MFDTKELDSLLCCETSRLMCSSGDADTFFDRIIHGFEGWNISSVKSELFLFFLNTKVGGVYKYVKTDLAFFPRRSICSYLTAPSLLSCFSSEPHQWLTVEQLYNRVSL